MTLFLPGGRKCDLQIRFGKTISPFLPSRIIEEWLALNQVVSDPKVLRNEATGRPFRIVFGVQYCGAGNNAIRCSGYFHSLGRERRMRVGVHLQHDRAAAHGPGGVGQLGSTGHVQIISGKGLATIDATDDVMQVFYNPDASGSNFGVAVEYGDITGDAVPDFVIGANEFDTAAYQDAGAVYIFTMESVK